MSIIIKPLEEFETSRWKRYYKDIKELSDEFMVWGQRLQEKYLNEDERKDRINRISDDGKFIVSVDINKFLGKE